MTVLYVILAIFMFGLLIVLHELGHFLTARLFGVGINEFSIGMGPKLFSWKGKPRKKFSPKPRPLQAEGEKFSEELSSEEKKAEEEQDGCTVYSLRALPFGGYVSMVGEDEESDDPAAFANKAAWKRLLIVIAGPLMNVLLGFLLMLIIVLASERLATNTVGKFVEGSVSDQYGLQLGDTVIEVGEVAVHTGNELVYEIMNQGRAEAVEGFVAIDLTVLRDGREIFLPAVRFPSTELEGVLFGTADFQVYGEEKSVSSVARHTFFRSVSTVKMIFDQLIDLLRGRYGLNAISGPIGITQEVASAAKLGLINVVYLMAVITVNLGVFNLLPLPALDGGRLLFILIELIAGRPVDKNVEGYIHLAGLLVLFGLMILVACKDIAGLFV
jgi:regulator of sigma E protease